MSIDPKTLNFIKEVDLLKRVERMCLVHNGGRRENTAEHSWHLGMAVLVFKDYAKNPISLERALSLALVHDIVEIDAGDTFVYADSSSKKINEELAIKRLTELLPDKAGEEIKNLWFEYENAETFEAQFVHALDRFLPIFSNHLNQGHSWKKNNIKASQVIAKNKGPILKALPELWDFCEFILSKALMEKYLDD